MYTCVLCLLCCVCVWGGVDGDGAVGMNGQNVARGGANAASSSAQHYASNSHKRASTGAVCVRVCLRFLWWNLYSRCTRVCVSHMHAA